jgi:hypothetical protein
LDSHPTLTLPHPRGRERVMKSDLMGRAENVVIPAQAGIQFFETFAVSNCLDARLRGHDEL